MTEKEAGEAADQLIDLFNNLSVMALARPDAVLSTNEVALIRDNLAKCIKAMTPRVTGRFSAIAAPMIVLYGLYLWSVRMQTTQYTPATGTTRRADTYVAPTPAPEYVNVGQPEYVNGQAHDPAAHHGNSEQPQTASIFTRTVPPSVPNGAQTG